MKFTEKDFPTYTIDKADVEHKKTITWIFTGDYAPIDNFWNEEPFWYRPNRKLLGFDLPQTRVRVTTSEHAFQAMKASHVKDFMRIAKAPTNHDTKREGNRLYGLRYDWSEVRYDVMWDVLLQKFVQCKLARRVLQRTKGRHIAEGNLWNDRVWGMTKTDNNGFVWTGQNALGKMLMKIRDEVL